MRQRLLRTLRDPLFVFCLLGAGCFLLFDAFSEDRQTIVVTEGLRALLVDDFTVLRGRPPDTGEQAALVERYINEEILFQEALSRGLHLGDPRLRLMLIEKMRFLLADIPADPSEEELLAYYMDHLSRYTSESRYSLRNIYFRSAPDDPQRILDALRAGREVTGDDGFWLGDEISGYHESVLRNVLGPAILPALEGMEVGEWAGPIESARGYHFVRLDQVLPSRPLRYEDVRPQVREDWSVTQRRASIEQRLQPLREQYAIRELPPSADGS